jgi:hypothetical protein
MYLFATGFGEIGDRRGRQQDRVKQVEVYLELQVPFRKDFKAFRQEVLTAIERHVAKDERKNIASKLTLLYEDRIKMYHKNYSFKDSVKTLPKSGLVPVSMALHFRSKKYTGFYFLAIFEPSEITLKDI